MIPSEKDILLETLVKEIDPQLSLPARKIISYQQILEWLAGYIRPLLDKNFDQLINILYRIDVPERKVTDMLNTHPDKDAAYMIASLILERTLQKIQTRQQFSNPDTDISDEEKW